MHYLEADDFPTSYEQESRGEPRPTGERWRGGGLETHPTRCSGVRRDMR